MLGTNEREDAHAFVVIFLRGGADTMNMFIPHGDDEYYATRPTIAIKKPQSGVAGCALKLTDFYGLHPRLEPLLPLFRDGRLGIVQSVGSDNPSGSHFEAQDQIEHGVANGQSNNGGWLGRYMQLRSRSSKSSPLSAVAIGATVPESLRGAPSASAIESLEKIQLETPAGHPQAVANALAKMYECDLGILRQPGRDTLDLLKKMQGLKEQQFKKTDKAGYPDTGFGKGLGEVAKLIKANVGVEVACLDLDGWDTHFLQGSLEGAQAELMGQLAKGIAAFDADIAPFRNRVTVIVQTEFGRRTYENGSLGTDHGRGFALMAIGDSVKGGTIHGDWPGLAGQAKDVIGPAGLTIKYDYRSVLSELLATAGGMKHIDQVFPLFQPTPVGLTKNGWIPSA